MVNEYQHISDKELIEHFYAEKDNKWLGVLFHRYTLLLLGVCMKYLKDEDEAKDAVQQVFIKALTEIPKYRIDFFKSWIYMVAKNHCLMQLRNSKNNPVALEDNLEYTVADNDLQLKKEQEISYEQLETGLAKLNPAQQHCIKLFYLEKKSYADIVANTNYTMLEVKSHIQNGKRNLKMYLLQQKVND